MAGQPAKKRENADDVADDGAEFSAITGAGSQVSMKSAINAMICGGKQEKGRFTSCFVDWETARGPPAGRTSWVAPVRPTVKCRERGGGKHRCQGP